MEAITKIKVIFTNSLSANPTKWPNTLKSYQKFSSQVALKD